MKNLKKVLSLVLALAMALSLMTTAFAADASDFNDYDGVTYNEAVDVMVAVGVFNGVEGNNFDADGTLTREMAAKIITYMLLGQTQADKLVATVAPYADVAVGRWSAGAITYCSNAGILAGVGGNNFAPTRQLTGLEFAKMLLVALGYDAENEGLTGSAWAINTASLAYDIGLDDGLNINLSGVLTREQAAQMAFTAMKTPLVYYKTTGSEISINGTVIGIGASAAEYVTTTRGNEQTISKETLTNTTNTYTVEFAERYCTDLKLVPNATDDFQRPAHDWMLKSSKIGTYVEEADLTYTAKVESGDIYKDLGLSKSVAASKVDLYVDGKEATSLLIAKGSDVKVGDSGNGVLTEVWYDDDAGTMIITQINTYVGKISSVTAATSTADRYVTISKAAGLAPTSLNTKFETESFAKDDIVTYTAAWNEASNRYDIVDVAVLEMTTTGTLTEWNGTSANLANDDKASANNNFTVAGETYKYSKYAYVVDENGFGSATDISAFDVDKSDLNIYLDQYGYAIYVTGIEGETNYAAIIGFGATNQYGSETRGATLLFPDGTQKEVVAKADNWSDYSTTSGKNLVTDGVADIVTYTVDDGVYKLTLVKPSTAVYDGTTYDDASSAAGADNYVTFVNGKSLFNLVSTAPGKAKTLYTTSETIFMVATKDGTKKAYNVYTGYANMPSLDTEDAINGIAYICNKSYPTQIDVVYLDVDNLAGISDVDTYLVKKADADIITNSKGDYYVLPAIVDGEETSVMVSADYVASTAVFTKADGKSMSKNFEDAVGLYALNNVTKNSNGIITGFSVVNDTVFNAENGGIGTVAANKVVLGLDGNKNTATYWAYNDKTEVYVVDKDYKTISVSSVSAVDTDANDLVYASHDGGSPEKKLADVIIVKQDDVVLSNEAYINNITVKDVAVKASDDAGVDYEVTVPASKLQDTTIQKLNFKAPANTTISVKYGTALGSINSTWGAWNEKGDLPAWIGNTRYIEVVVTSQDGSATETAIIKMVGEAAGSVTALKIANNVASGAITIASSTITIDTSKTGGNITVAQLKAALVVGAGTASANDTIVVTDWTGTAAADTTTVISGTTLTYKNDGGTDVVYNITVS